MSLHRSGGGTALDPVDVTFSDSDADSDTPQFVPSPIKIAPESLPGPSAQPENLPAEPIVDEGNVGPDFLLSEAPSIREPVPSISVSNAVKRSRNSSPSRAPLQPVKRAKNTARKSTQHISTTQRLGWEAARKLEEERADSICYDDMDSMQLAGGEARRSQSARRTTSSPEKDGITAALAQATTLALHDVAGPSRFGNERRDSLTPQASSSHNPSRPSPFQVSDTPGSWGHVVPMMPQRTIPQSNLSGPVSAMNLDLEVVTRTTDKREADEAAVSESPAVTAVIRISEAPPSAASSPHAPPASSSKARQGPKWATSVTPSPERTPSPAAPVPVSQSEDDELESELDIKMSLGDSRAPNRPLQDDVAYNEPTSAVMKGPKSIQPSATDLYPADVSAPEQLSARATFGKTATHEPKHMARPTVAISPTQIKPVVKTIFARAPSPEPMMVRVRSITAAVPGIRTETLSMTTPETSLLAPAPAGLPRSQDTMADPVLDPVESIDQLNSLDLSAGMLVNEIFQTEVGPVDPSMLAEKRDTFQPELGAADPPASAADEEACHPDAGSTKTQGAGSVYSESPISQPITKASNATSSEVTDSVMSQIAVGGNNHGHHDHRRPVEESIELLRDSVQEVDVSRSRGSSSSSGIEEIPADIARTQSVFVRSAMPNPTSRPRRLQSTVHNHAASDRVPEAGPGRRTRQTMEPVALTTSSCKESPSKRLSSRLASRILTPVYSFSAKYTKSPITWRQTVEMDGDSDAEGFLAATPTSSASSSSGPLSMTVDGRQRTISHLYTFPVIDRPPPLDRRQKGKRSFDTRLIDEWNRMSPTMTQNPALHRLIFESYIDECVEGAEPEIKVHNTVDRESIPPHLEFQYSNDMLYHADVPDPELGKGCDCEGGCSEESDSCSCLKRQEAYNYGVNRGFAYDKHGHLKQAVPIWECGPNCGCPPACMNRVIQRGRKDKALVDLFKTKQKGWGVRARAPIAAGTFLGIYAGEIITEAESERRGNIYAEVGRTYLFDCDGWQISNPPAKLESLDPRLAELAYASAQRAKAAMDEDDSGWVYNAYSVDAFHYGFTRFFNHSCDPNLQIVQAYVKDFHPERPLLVIFTRREVRPGEELCISYKGVPDEEEEEMEVTQPSKRTGKAKKVTRKKNQKSAVAHVTAKDPASKDRCFCGARNCDGVMFKIDAAD